MIDTKQHLIELLPSLYDSLNIPLFLLNKKIISSTQHFFQLEKDYFMNILDEKIFTSKDNS